MTSSRVAVVTGGGRGIGKATAARLAADGFHVVVVDIDPATAEAAADEIRAAGHAAEGIALDVTDRDAVFAAFAGVAERHGRLDALVNAAMRVLYRPIEEFDEDAVDVVLGIGFKAVLWTVQAALPAMRAQGSGAIVNFSSPAATRPMPTTSIYSAVKGAVSSLTWQLAIELGGDGIRVNGVIPGAVPTEGARAVVDEAGYEARKKGNALGRLGTPEDIAAAVSFLVSDDASYVTGHLLAVDGRLL